jgi:hypothetical protein
VRRLETLRGWSWDARSDKWETGFAALRRDVEREGHARPPNHHREGEFGLGGWVYKQRAAHAAGRLDPERAHRLAALPGWKWTERLRPRRRKADGWGDRRNRRESGSGTPLPRSSRMRNSAP